MSAQAEQLQELMGFFKLADEGHATRTARPAAQAVSHATSGTSLKFGQGNSVKATKATPSRTQRTAAVTGVDESAFTNF
jgi:hypothetical protein